MPGISKNSELDLEINIFPYPGLDLLQASFV